MVAHSSLTARQDPLLNEFSKSERIEVKQALVAWRALLGEDAVLTANETLQQYGRDCGLKEVQPLAVLLPKSFSELRESVRIAHHFAVPIYPSSKGKNWGYGAASPIALDSVVIDLRFLNRIIEVNEELAYAVIEPGVTQQQLFDYLEAHHSTLCMDVTGASPDSSLIGNLVERGYGQTPYGDRFQHSSGMEVLLADGSTIRTGFWHFKESSCQHLYKWGIGPSIDGIFTQSNFGIVTKVGFWLMRKPSFIGLVKIEINSDQEMGPLISKLRDLKLRGLLPATVHVSNDIRLLSCFAQFPYESESGKQPLSEAARRALRKQWKFAAWTCFTSLRGSRREVRTAISEIRNALKGIANVDLVTSDSVRKAKLFGWIYEWIFKRDLRQTSMLYSLVSGKPSSTPILGAFWRHARAPSTNPADPIKDECGIVWLAPVIPSTAQDVSCFLQIVNSCMREAGFETNLTLTMLSERALCCTIAITFDKQQDRDRAQSCYDALLEQCLLRGYIPYRHGINVEQVSQSLFRADDPFWNVCRKLKSTLDEKHIIAPGKYGIW